jgi:hypothetical protein
MVYLFWFQPKKNFTPNAASTSASYSMQLQAYERLTLLVERIALPNIISRLSQNGIGARDMQQLLTQSIRQEFEHNITQQIYVSPDAWTAVKNLKEQNMLIINQLASTLPAHATGLDLNKLLLQFLMNDKKGTLHEVVNEVLSYEAKKLF